MLIQLSLLLHQLLYLLIVLHILVIFLHIYLHFITFGLYLILAHLSLKQFSLSGILLIECSLPLKLLILV